nr:MAG TPA: hypothetical protein [Caudoviricetes sp.]
MVGLFCYPFSRRLKLRASGISLLVQGFYFIVIYCMIGYSEGREDK